MIAGKQDGTSSSRMAGDLGHRGYDRKIALEMASLSRQRNSRLMARLDALSSRVDSASLGTSWDTTYRKATALRERSEALKASSQMWKPHNHPAPPQPQAYPAWASGMSYPQYPYYGYQLYPGMYPYAPGTQPPPGPPAPPAHASRIYAPPTQYSHPMTLYAQPSLGLQSDLTASVPSVSGQQYATEGSFAYAPPLVVPSGYSNSPHMASVSMSSMQTHTQPQPQQLEQQQPPTQPRQAWDLDRNAPTTTSHMQQASQARLPSQHPLVPAQEQQEQSGALVPRGASPLLSARGTMQQSLDDAEQVLATLQQNGSAAHQSRGVTNASPVGTTSVAEFNELKRLHQVESDGVASRLEQELNAALEVTMRQQDEEMLMHVAIHEGDPQRTLRQIEASYDPMLVKAAASPKIARHKAIAAHPHISQQRYTEGEQSPSHSYTPHQSLQTTQQRSRSPTKAHQQVPVSELLHKYPARPPMPPPQHRAQQAPPSRGQHHSYSQSRESSPHRSSCDVSELYSIPKRAQSAHVSTSPHTLPRRRVHHTAHGSTRSPRQLRPTEHHTSEDMDAFSDTANDLLAHSLRWNASAGAESLNSSYRRSPPPSTATSHRRSLSPHHRLTADSYTLPNMVSHSCIDDTPGQAEHQTFPQDGMHIRINESDGYDAEDRILPPVQQHTVQSRNSSIYQPSVGTPRRRQLSHSTHTSGNSRGASPRASYRSSRHGTGEHFGTSLQRPELHESRGYYHASSVISGKASVQEASHLDTYDRTIDYRGPSPEYTFADKVVRQHQEHPPPPRSVSPSHSRPIAGDCVQPQQKDEPSPIQHPSEYHHAPLKQQFQHRLPDQVHLAPHHAQSTLTPEPPSTSQTHDKLHSPPYSQAYTQTQSHPQGRHQPQSDDERTPPPSDSINVATPSRSKQADSQQSPPKKSWKNAFKFASKSKSQSSFRDAASPHDTSQVSPTKQSPKKSSSMRKTISSLRNLLRPRQSGTDATQDMQPSSSPGQSQHQSYPSSFQDSRRTSAFDPDELVTIARPHSPLSSANLRMKEFQGKKDEYRARMGTDVAAEGDNSLMMPQEKVVVLGRNAQGTFGIVLQLYCVGSAGDQTQVGAASFSYIHKVSEPNYLDNTGPLRVGDRIVAVNSVRCGSATDTEVRQLMFESDRTVELTVIHDQDAYAAATGCPDVDDTISLLHDSSRLGGAMNPSVTSFSTFQSLASSIDEGKPYRKSRPASRPSSRPTSPFRVHSPRRTVSRAFHDSDAAGDDVGTNSPARRPMTAPPDTPRSPRLLLSQRSARASVTKIPEEEDEREQGLPHELESDRAVEAAQREFTGVSTIVESTNSSCQDTQEQRQSPSALEMVPNIVESARAQASASRKAGQEEIAASPSAKEDGTDSDSSIDFDGLQLKSMAQGSAPELNLGLDTDMRSSSQPTPTTPTAPAPLSDVQRSPTRRTTHAQPAEVHTIQVTANSSDASDQSDSEGDDNSSIDFDADVDAVKRPTTSSQMGLPTPPQPRYPSQAQPESQSDTRRSPNSRIPTSLSALPSSPVGFSTPASPVSSIVRPRSPLGRFTQAVPAPTRNMLLSSDEEGDEEAHQGVFGRAFKQANAVTSQLAKVDVGVDSSDNDEEDVSHGAVLRPHGKEPQSTSGTTLPKQRAGSSQPLSQQGASDSEDTSSLDFIDNAPESGPQQHGMGRMMQHISDSDSSFDLTDYDDDADGDTQQAAMILLRAQDAQSRHQQAQASRTGSIGAPQSQRRNLLVDSDDDDSQTGSRKHSMVQENPYEPIHISGGSGHSPGRGTSDGVSSLHFPPSPHNSRPTSRQKQRRSSSMFDAELDQSASPILPSSPHGSRPTSKQRQRRSSTAFDMLQDDVHGPTLLRSPHGSRPTSRQRQRLVSDTLEEEEQQQCVGEGNSSADQTKLNQIDGDEKYREAHPGYVQGGSFGADSDIYSRADLVASDDELEEEPTSLRSSRRQRAGVRPHPLAGSIVSSAPSRSHSALPPEAQLIQPDDFNWINTLESLFEQLQDMQDFASVYYDFIMPNEATPQPEAVLYDMLTRIEQGQALSTYDRSQLVSLVLYVLQYFPVATVSDRFLQCQLMHHPTQEEGILPEYFDAPAQNFLVLVSQFFADLAISAAAAPPRDPSILARLHSTNASPKRGKHQKGKGDGASANSVTDATSTLDGQGTSDGDFRIPTVEDAVRQLSSAIAPLILPLTSDDDLASCDMSARDLQRESNLGIYQRLRALMTDVETNGERKSKTQGDAESDTEPDSDDEAMLSMTQREELESLVAENPSLINVILQLSDDMPDLADPLMSMFLCQKEAFAMLLIDEAVRTELDCTDSPDQLFQRNSCAERLLRAFVCSPSWEWLMKLTSVVYDPIYAAPHLYDLESPKANSKDQLNAEFKVAELIQAFFFQLKETIPDVPVLVRHTLSTLRLNAAIIFPSFEHKAIRSFFFLRFLTMALTDPVRHGIKETEPSDAIMSVLKVVVKIIQTIVNGGQFSPHGVPNLTHFQPLVQANRRFLSSYLDIITLGIDSHDFQALSDELYQNREFTSRVLPESQWKVFQYLSSHRDSVYDMLKAEIPPHQNPAHACHHVLGQFISSLFLGRVLFTKAISIGDAMAQLQPYNVAKQKRSFTDRLLKRSKKMPFEVVAPDTAQ
eukprot:m.183097 g.183097  ORF g.183097 m.183097 type:complete len:2640 (+) comp14687_c0_seq3:221-8140(+)